MLTHYGWLMAFGDVDHPATEKHQGHVYLHKSDIVDGEKLMAGDIVSFYLYVDEHGLGAEWCSVEERKSCGLNPDAFEFVPADKEIPVEMARLEMKADAQEFIPGNSFSYEPDSQPLHDPMHPVADVFSRLSNVLSSDDELSEEEADEEDDSKVSVTGIANVFLRLSRTLASIDEDDSDQEGDSDISHTIQLSDSMFGQEAHSEDETTSHVSFQKSKTRSPSQDGSTSAGSTSESDGENSCDGRYFLQRKCDLIRPPPGLANMVCFRPPPGLLHPSEEDM